MSIKFSGRRGFVHRLTALAAGIGAMALGVVPEARSATALAGAVTSDLPPSPALPLEIQNALYSSALNDANVALLLGTLPSPGRLDPPQQSSDMSFDGGARLQTVVIPVVSYADGSAMAYVFYGSATNIAAGISGTVPSLAAIVTTAGSLQMAVAGRLYDHPTPQWNSAFFATFFPSQYLDAGPVPTRTSLRRVAPNREKRWAFFNPALLIKTNAVGGPGTPVPTFPAQAICLNNCKISAILCIGLLTTSLVGALACMLWCGLCIIGAVGVIVAAPVSAPVTIPAALTGCGWGCSSAVALITTTLILVTACQSSYAACVAVCMAMPPPPAPPVPPTPPVVPDPDKGWPTNPFMPGPGNPIKS
jgi:hypothetical protein